METKNAEEGWQTRQRSGNCLGNLMRRRLVPFWVVASRYSFAITKYYGYEI